MLKDFENFLKKQTAPSLGDENFILAVGLLVGCLILAKLVHSFVFGLLIKRGRERQWTLALAFMEGSRGPFSAYIVLLGLHVSLGAIHLARHLGWSESPIPGKLFDVGVAVLLIWLLYNISEGASRLILQFAGDRNQLAERQFRPLIRRSLRSLALILGFLLLIQNMGYSIASLLTGLGIGGLAVALAAQETLSNVFSSFMILTDPPFRVGDAILFKNIEGTVESINFRTTRVRTFSGSLVTLPNKLLTNDAIENYSTRDRRQVKLQLSFVYGTDGNRITKFIQEIESYLNRDQDFIAETVLVRVIGFRDSSIDVRIQADCRRVDLPAFSTIVQALSLKVLQVAEDLGISFTYPMFPTLQPSGKA